MSASISNTTLFVLQEATFLTGWNDGLMLVTLPYIVAETIFFGLFTTLVIQVVSRNRSSAWKIAAIILMYCFSIIHLATLLRKVYLNSQLTTTLDQAAYLCVSEIQSGSRNDVASACAEDAFSFPQYSVPEAVTIMHMVTLIVNMAISNVWMLTRVWKLWSNPFIRVASVFIVLVGIVFLGFWARAEQITAITVGSSAAIAIGLTLLNVLWSTVLVLWQTSKRRREAKHARSKDATTFKIYIAVEVVDLLFWIVMFIAVLVSVFTNVLSKDETLEFSILTFDTLSFQSYVIQLIGLYNGAILYIEQDLEPVRKDGFRTLDEKHVLESSDGHNMNAAESHQLYDPYAPVV